MDALFIPTENDFRKWIMDAVKECLENTLPKGPPAGKGGFYPKDTLPRLSP